MNNQWSVTKKSYSYSKINDEENSSAYLFRNSHRHIKPEEECWINNKKIQCNKSQKSISDKSWFRGKQEIPITTSCVKLKTQKECNNNKNCIFGDNGTCAPKTVREHYKNKYLKYKKKYLNIIRKNLIGGT